MTEMRRSQSWLSMTLLLLLLTFGAFACKHPAAPPPPTPVAAVTPPVTPPPPVPAPTIALRADSVTITRGASTTLTWTATNAATVDIQPGIGQVPLTGSRSVSPASSVTYTATATAAGGRTAADTLRVTVNEPAPPPPPTVVPPRGPTTVVPTPNLTTQQIFERDMQPISFDYDKSDIREDQKSKLQSAAAFLKMNPNVRVTVEGHADERGSEEYNLALGDRRANAVKLNLISQGIAESRLSSVSYGEERPLCSAQTEDCYAMNRRAQYRMNP